MKVRPVCSSSRCFDKASRRFSESYCKVFSVRFSCWFSVNYSMTNSTYNVTNHIVTNTGEKKYINYTDSIMCALCYCVLRLHRGGRTIGRQTETDRDWQTEYKFSPVCKAVKSWHIFASTPCRCISRLAASTISPVGMRKKELRCMLFDVVPQGIYFQAGTAEFQTHTDTSA